MKILLDTCAVIWAVAFPEKLSTKSREALDDPYNNFCVSVISCGELACAVDRGRITLDRHWKIWFRNFIEKNGWECISIDLEIMEEAYSLPQPFHADPADRIIAATSRVTRLPVLTSDTKLIDYPHVDVIW